MPRITIIAAIAACYFVFAILLNSVGTVILQSINSFDIGKPEASTLEGFKDLSIAFVSFLVASIIPRIGYKIALFSGLALGMVGCLLVPAIGAFWSVKVMFALVGSAFALVKISVYSIVGLLTNDTDEHSSLLNIIEGIFMLGVLSGYWYFSAFIDDGNTASLGWLNVYWGLAASLVLIMLLVKVAPIPPSHQLTEPGASVKQEFLSMLSLIIQPLVLVFIISIFMYVLIEQGIGTWLPTFNNEVLSIPASLSVQITSIFALSLAFGRLMAGFVLKLLTWYQYSLLCLAGMAVLIAVSLPLARPIEAATELSLLDLPFVAYLFPFIGLFMAPLYPILNSVVLSNLPRQRQSSMTGLIVVFSALGGTTGSILTGTLFEQIGGQQAFYTLLVPVVGISIAITVLRGWSKTPQQASVVS